MTRSLKSPLFVLALVALAFLYLTSWAGTPPGDIWNSPDETANAFWAGRVQEREPLLLRDFAVGLGNGAVHPRSFDVVGSALVPGSFPGLFLLYGGIAFFTGLPFSVMTPIITALSALVLFALFRRLFRRDIAFWAAVLFLVHPAVIYYSARGLFHNVLFVDLLILAIGLFMLRPFGKGLKVAPWTDDVLTGIALGFALMTRLSEAVWVLPAALTLLPFMGKARWKRVLHVVLGGLLPLFILLSFNASTYGSVFGSPYSAPAPTPVEVSVAGEAAAEAAETSSVLPFGFHPRLVVLHGMDYGLEIFWWFSLAGILGLTVFLMEWRRETRPRRAYLLVVAGITVWLLIFYGSWFVRDHWDPTRVTIGTSYVRYFLPIYILTLPWVAEGLLWASARLRFDRKKAMTVFVLLFTLLSLRVAVTEGDESLLAVRKTLEGNLEKRTLLKRAIPYDSVIVTERFDKVLFPDRMRIIPSMDPASLEVIPVLAEYVPVYWYGVAPSEERGKEISELVWDLGFVFERMESPIEGEGLFKFTEHGQEE